MKILFRNLICYVFIIAFFFAGCAYIGFHGKSIRNFPDMHHGFVKDAECLDCHHPDNLEDNAPAVPHPGFTGCLKCHNDESR